MLNKPQPTNTASQRAWDAAGKERDKQSVWNAASSPQDKARVLAATATHSGDWLQTLPISACGLRLDDEAIRVAVGLRLGLPLCAAHRCSCGAEVDPGGVRGLSFKQGADRAARHQQLNDLISKALRNADISAIKEPTGLNSTDGKRPDGLILVPWQSGRCLTWDITVVDTLSAT